LGQNGATAGSISQRQKQNLQHSEAAVSDWRRRLILLLCVCVCVCVCGWTSCSTVVGHS